VRTLRVWKYLLGVDHTVIEDVGFDDALRFPTLVEAE
jgi:hypothetical protein